LVDVLDYEQPTEYIVENTEYNNSFKTPVLTAGKSFILGHTNEEYGIFKEPLPVIIFDDFTTATQFVDFPFKVKSSAMKILKAKKGKANITFLYYLMQHIEFDSSDHKRYWISQYSQIQIPLPQLSIQREIVAEIDGYQKIINGAKSVVDNYKPRIDIDPEWKMVELGELISTQTGGTPSKLNEEYWQGQIPWVSPKDMKVDFISDAKDYISEEAVNNSSTKIVPRDTILIVVRSGILKHTLPIALTVNPVSFNQDIIAIQPASDSIIQKYLFYYLKSTAETHIKDGIKPGVTVQSFHNGYFKRLNIPLPTLEMQCQIISQIEKEQELVDANKQLIVMFEQKIKDRIAKVWGE